MSEGVPGGSGHTRLAPGDRVYYEGAPETVGTLVAIDHPWRADVHWHTLDRHERVSPMRLVKLSPLEELAHEAPPSD